MASDFARWKSLRKAQEKPEDKPKPRKVEAVEDEAPHAGEGHATQLPGHAHDATGAPPEPIKRKRRKKHA